MHRFLRGRHLRTTWHLVFGRHANESEVPWNRIIMSTALMMEQIAGASPRLKARIAGALWLIIIIAAAFAEFFVRGRIVVDRDAAATATNILAHESLYRLGA